MMINCEKSTELISKKKDQQLTFIEKISLRIHQMICKACELFEVESDTISDSIKYSMKNIPKMKTKKKEELEKLLNTNSK